MNKSEREFIKTIVRLMKSDCISQDAVLLRLEMLLNRRYGASRQ